MSKFTLSDERKEAYAWLTRNVERKRKMDRDNSTDFFSDFWLTRNAQGEAKFVFIFDMESFFEKRSEYKDFYSRMNNMERLELKKQVNIPSFKVKRKRVKKITDKHGSTVIDFPDEYTHKTVITTSKPQNRQSIIKTTTEDGAIMQINISEVSNKDLMFLTGTDYQMANITDGHYAYGVSVEVVDGMREYLLSQLQRLRNQITSMKKIHVESILPTHQEGQTTIKNYDADTNLYVRPLKEITGTDFTSSSLAVRKVYQLFAEEPISAYAYSSLFKSRKRTYKRTGIEKKINNLFNIDKIKSPTELEMLIEIMETLLRNSLAVIGEPTPMAGTVGRKSVSSSDRIIKAEKFYTTPDMLFDSNVPKLTGMEYLATNSDVSASDVLSEINTLAYDVGDIGIRVIDGAAWESRAFEEVNKFFPSGSTSVQIQTDNSSTPESSTYSLLGTGSEYFTLSYYNTEDDNQQPLVYRGVSSNIADTAEIIKKNVLIYEASEESIFLSKYGITAYNSEDRVTLLGGDSGNTDSSSRSSRSPDTDTTDNIYNNPELVEEIEEQKQFEKFIFSKMSDNLNSPFLGTSNIFMQATNPTPSDMLTLLMSDDSRLKRTRTEEIEAAPNQVLSQYQAIMSGNAGGQYRVSESFLTKIEFLKGFESDTESESVSIPIWEGLTIDTYKNNASKNLLCRIKRHNSERLGVRTTASGVPIYDSVFVINPVGNFTYEYLEDIEIDNQDVRSVYQEMLRQELQELVYNEWISSRRVRFYQEEYLRESIEPRLIVARDERNYRNVRDLNTYQLQKRRDDEMYEQAGWKGFALEFRKKLAEVQQAQNLVRTDAPYAGTAAENLPFAEGSSGNTARWYMIEVELLTESIRENYRDEEQNYRRPTRETRISKEEEIRNLGYTVTMTSYEKDSEGNHIIRPEFPTHPIVTIMTPSEATAREAAGGETGQRLAEQVEQGIQAVTRRGY